MTTKTKEVEKTTADTLGKLTDQKLAKLPALFSVDLSSKNLTAGLINFASIRPSIPFDGNVNYISKKTGHTTKFDYATLPAIIKLIRPALCQSGLAVIQGLKDGRVFTKISHINGEYELCEEKIPPAKDMQDLGAKITYLKRYQLSSMLLLGAEYDDDGGTGEFANVEQKDATKAKQPKTQAETDAEILRFLKNCKSLEKIVQAKPHLSDVTKPVYVAKAKELSIDAANKEPSLTDSDEY